MKLLLALLIAFQGCADIPKKKRRRMRVVVVHRTDVSVDRAIAKALRSD